MISVRGSETASLDPVVGWSSHSDLTAETIVSRSNRLHGHFPEQDHGTPAANESRDLSQRESSGGPRAASTSRCCFRVDGTMRLEDSVCVSGERSVRRRNIQDPSIS